MTNESMPDRLVNVASLFIFMIGIASIYFVYQKNDQINKVKIFMINEKLKSLKCYEK